MVEAGGATATLAVKQIWREIAAGRIEVGVALAVDARYEPGGDGDVEAALKEGGRVSRASSPAKWSSTPR